jgi:hypothetical protein
MIKGTFKECLQHYLKKYAKDSTVICGFTTITTSSERRWRTKGILPVGVNLIRVIYFLDLLGYQIEEIVQLDKVTYIVGKAVAFDLITADAVAIEIGVLSNSFYRYFYGAKASPDTLVKIEALASQFGAQVEARSTEETAKLFAALNISPSELRKRSVLAASATAGAHQSESFGKNTDDLIAMFESACLITRTTGEQLLASSVEVRKALRKRMSQGEDAAIHKTYEVLHKLMKERTTSNV